MSRFKELTRVERAVNNGNEEELNWAKQYCEMRLRHVRMKKHQKQWDNLLSRILQKRAEAEAEDD
tara:strand:- start:19211 stop:19405 length:195 start_codon:yes stop_codon:yes gene_type:complete